MASRTSKRRLFRKLAAAGLFLAGLCAIACNLANDGGHTFLHVETDTAWAGYDSLDIRWKDTASGAHGILFQGKPGQLDAANKLPADEYKGQPIEFIIQGYKGGHLVRQETRHFDGKDANRITVDTLKPSPDGKNPNPDSIPQPKPKPHVPSITLLTPDTTLTIGDSLAFSASVSQDSGSLHSYAWNFAGDTLPGETVGGNSALVRGGHRYIAPGNFTVTLKVVSDSGLATIASLHVRVLQDLPTADAGRDTTVFPEATLHLHGAGHDGIGSVIATGWKIGDRDFLPGPGGLTLTAPAAGDLVCVFRVTDDDSQTVADTMLVHVVPRGESNLTELLVSKGVLSPRFNPAIFDYADTLAYPDSSLTIVPTGNGRVTVDGDSAGSGRAAAPIRLQVGTDTVRIKVRLDSAPEKIYTLALTRLRPASDIKPTDLAGLALSAGRIVSDFTPDGLFYSLSVANDVASTKVTAILEDTSASLTIDAHPAQSGVPLAVDLPVGIKYVAVIVAAPGGVRKTYTVAVTRARNANALLKSLKVAGPSGPIGPLAPAFESSVFAYTLTVANSVDSVWVTATDSSHSSTITLNQAAVNSGARSGSFPLKVGANPIEVTVMAESGALLKYTLTVTRAGSGRNELAALALAGIPFDTVFTSADTLYSAEVPNATASAALSAKAADSAAGVAFQPGSNLALDTGWNRADVIVTAQDGSKKTYRIRIHRALNGNADLAGLSLSAGALAPIFTPAQTAYLVVTPNETAATTVTALPAAGTSQVTMGGQALVPGTASTAIPLSVGTDTLQVTVTAQDGTRKTYAVAVTRSLGDKATLADLSVTATGATTLTMPFSPNFAPGILAYTYTTTNFPNTIDIKPTATQAGATLKLNGVATPSGSVTTYPLQTGGTTLISILVVAENRVDSQTYTLSIASQPAPQADTLLTVSGSFVVPPYITSMNVMLVGGGGGGGADADGLSSWTYSGSGGGGGQGGVRYMTLAVQPGQRFTYRIGTGGDGGPSGGTGSGIGGSPGTLTVFANSEAPGGSGGGGGQKTNAISGGGVGGAAGNSQAGSPVTAAGNGMISGNGGKGGGRFLRHFPNPFGVQQVFAEGGDGGIGSPGNYSGGPFPNTSGGQGGPGCGGGGAGSGDASIAGSKGGSGFVYIFWGN